VCVCGLAALKPAGAQNPQQPAAPAQQPGQQPGQPAAPQRNNPFETIPQAEAPKPAPAQAPAAPQFEAPKPAEPGALPPIGSDIIEGLEFRGARRVPQDTLRSMIFSKTGDVYNEDTLRRGFIVRFVVTERPVIRDIKYEGAKSVTTSDILDRFKERKVGLTVESMYDPNVVNHAAVVLKDLVAEHGHQFATVTPELRRIPPSSLEVIFT